MLKRKIEKKLIAWKNTENRKPLIIKGCRQCGKTFSVLDFAKKNYKNVVYLNFFENPDYVAVFSGSLEVDTIVMMLSALLGKEAVFESGNTVKGYGKEPKSVPVGSETVIDMYPLDFEEFLWANGIETPVIELLKTCLQNEKTVPEALHKRMKQLLLQYTVVGGMPDVVQTDDMIKYAEKKDKSRIKECFQSIPKQLSKENKKFQYSIVKKGSTASKYAGSLQWIEDAGIIVRCYNLSITELPLDGNAEENTFKVYMRDCGLFFKEIFMLIKEQFSKI
mgnify:CR=1 FL=1